MKNTYKKYFYMALLMISTSLNAQQLKEMGDFLKKIKSNPARGENAEFNFSAYVQDIEIVTENNGKRIAAVELGNDNLNGIIISWGMTKLVCFMQPKEAAKLDKKQKINVNGKIYNTEKYQEYNKISNSTLNGLQINAVCQVSPAINDAPIEPQKANRKSEENTAASIKNSSLCEEGDGIIFSCSTGKKTAAVCTSKNNFYYRYGISKNSLDITVDGNGAKVGQYPLSGGEVWYYRFSNGKTNYVVYTAESSTIDKAGIVVEKEGKQIASLACKNAAIVNQNLAGPASDTKGFDIP